MELSDLYTPEYFMREALKEARKALEEDEVPIGAVIVSNKKIIARAYNQTQQLNDPTAHAEMIAITSATNYLGGKYLENCQLYVTIEPCVMCSGALYWAQIDEIIFGASDDKRGFMRYGKTMIHPKTKLSCGVLQKECAEMLTHFFKSKR
jgi:tRNA(adenine34) deaminase